MPLNISENSERRYLIWKYHSVIGTTRPHQRIPRIKSARHRRPPTSCFPGNSRWYLRGGAKILPHITRRPPPTAPHSSSPLFFVLQKKKEKRKPQATPCWSSPRSISAAAAEAGGLTGPRCAYPIRWYPSGSAPGGDSSPGGCLIWMREARRRHGHPLAGFGIGGRGGGRGRPLCARPDARLRQGDDRRRRRRRLLQDRHRAARACQDIAAGSSDPRAYSTIDLRIKASNYNIVARAHRSKDKSLGIRVWFAEIN